VAVDLFINGRIKFLEIYEIIETAMNNHELREIESLEIIKNVDKETRKWVYENYGKN
ncbi:MAG: 1-deoxy-D-xylulose-5-phosphate reductoisomerase, partial [Cetobacterium sp.]